MAPVGNGMMINGTLHQVPGVTILEPGRLPWNYLAKFGHRTAPIQAKILHKTVADDPEIIVEEPPEEKYARFYGYAQLTLDWWHNPTKPDGTKLPPLSGTQLVTGHNGETVNPADLAKIVGYHGNQANERSWGHEIKEYVGGRVHRVALSAAVAITCVDTSVLGVQWQTPHKYTGPLKRWSKRGHFGPYDFGPDLVGVFQHCDVTSDRNVHDAGEEVRVMLMAKGFEVFDFAAGEDLEVWGKRQERMKALGYYTQAIDGIAGQGTRNALVRLGYPDGIFARWRELAEKPPGDLV